MAKCAICSKKVEKEFVPFCSHRCQQVDLGHWASGTYSVPVIEDDPYPDSETDHVEH